MSARPARPTPRRASPGAGTLSLVVAIAVAALLAAIAWRLRTLSGSGALAAGAVGTATLFGAGWWGGGLLLAFFIGSTAVSRATRDPAVERGEAKGNTRDWAQVLANGGAPAVGALLGLTDPAVGAWALAIGLAAAAADTWATSLGAMSRKPPRHLISREAVAPGTSGGVTWLGTLGGALGALSVGIVAWCATRDPRLLAAAALLGTAAMLLDSLLGATAQGRFHCDRCQVATERSIHRCGTPTRPIGGLAWLTNDGVNATATTLATLAGAILGATVHATGYFVR